MIRVLEVTDGSGRQFYLPHHNVIAWRGDGSGGTHIYVRGVPWEEQPYIHTKAAPDQVQRWWSAARESEFIRIERRVPP